MKVDEFLASKAGKRLLVIGGLVLLIGTVVMVWLMTRRPETPNIVSEEYDPISGETIRHIDQEPVDPWDGVHLLGFRIFSEVGYTARRQEIIFTAIQGFFTENRPDIKRLSYRRDSLTYDESDQDTVYFELVSEAGDTFRVRLDLEASIFNTTVYIYDVSGNLLN